MRINKAICLVLLIIFLGNFVACSQDEQNKNKGETTMVSLNDRQISICEDLGLPTSYDKLTADQQTKIIRIEEMLAFLDNKYNASFSYVGYYEPFLEPEKLEAFPENFNEYEFVTLTVREDGTFVDDYPFVIVGRLAREDIITCLSSKAELECKAYVIAGETSLNDATTIDMPAISGKSWISFTIFVGGDKLADDAKKIGEIIGEWYKHNGIYGSTNVVAIDPKVFDLINFENYQSVKREQGVGNLVTCDVSSSGEVVVH